ncbi:MAG: sulfite exporter TauE/SafE family protein [Alphaproteobacteria bacterium]|nr:sulfite exporter TauE/SafE family protein [Alphaproteobacteria bacterium]
MESYDIMLLAVDGVIGGACNAIAGGGTFFTFPALLSVGIPPVVANATSAISIWPGHATSLVSYRPELRRHAGRLKMSTPVFVLGSIVGAGLLSVTGNGLFRDLIPWLLLSATVLFAAGPKLRSAILVMRSDHLPVAVTVLLDFVVAVYGGYFGAGLGILLMAILTLIGIEDLNEANALKNAFATIVSSVAVAIFIASGIIAWGPGAVVLAGAVAGGYIGARIARWVNPMILRAVIIFIGLGLTWLYL